MRAPARSASLATRLGLFFSLGLATVVALGGFAVYWNVNAALERELRDDLADKIQQLRLASGDFERRPDDVRRNFFSAPAEDGVVRPLIRILDASGRRLFESKGMVMLKLAPFPAPIEPDSNHFPVSKWTHESGRRFRLVSARISAPSPDGRSYVAELALDATRERRLLSRIRSGLFLGGLLGMLLAFFLGRALASQGLKPLSEIGQAASTLSPEQMSFRLSSQGWSSELSELAEAFNTMLARLKWSFENLNRHSAVLSHELRTPLHHLRLHSEVVLAKDRSSLDYRRALEANLEEILRLSRTIDSVLFLSRAADRRQALKLESFDPAEDMRELAEFYGPAAEQAGLRFAIHGSGRVFADRELCRRALSNLISNALRHGPAGSEISLRVVLEAGRTRCEVMDVGPGIPEPFRAQIFEPFYRVPGADAGEGSGLGLAIVKHIVELHGGEAFFESPAQGGARVGFWLPVN